MAEVLRRRKGLCNWVLVVFLTAATGNCESSWCSVTQHGRQVGLAIPGSGVPEEKVPMKICHFCTLPQVIPEGTKLKTAGHLADTENGPGRNSFFSELPWTSHSGQATLSARLIMELHTMQHTDQHSALTTSQWHILEKPKATVFLYMSCDPSSGPVGRWEPSAVKSLAWAVDSYTEHMGCADMYWRLMRGKRKWCVRTERC